jgi:hypothetical protein
MTSRIFLLVLVVLLGVEVFGFATANPIHLNAWYPEGPWRLVQFAGIYSACATTILILLPWIFVRLFTSVLVVLTAIALGPSTLLAVALLLVSAWCLGRALGLTSYIALLAGLSIYLFAMSIVARLPVHYPAVYLIVLVVPIALRWRTLNRLKLPNLPLDTWGERAAFAVLMFSLATHWFAMLKPESGADGLSMHLAIPMDMAVHHALTYEPSRWVWAVMPMGGDFLWSIVYTLGGELATHLFNYAMLLVMLGLLYGLLRQWISCAPALLLVALFSSSPMVQWVTGTLMAENLLAVLILGAVAAIWQFGCERDPRVLYAAALLAGAAISTKLGAITLVLVGMPFVFVARPARRVWLTSIVILLLSAAPPYVTAWAKTGNPLFPFLNDRFHSPLLAPHSPIADQRFHEPLAWDTVYGLTFNTHSYSEGRDGELGFQYLLLAPLALLALFANRSREVVGATAIAIVSSILILCTTPIARYLYEGLPLLYIPLAALLAWSTIHSRMLWRGLLGACAACIALNTGVLSAQGYYYSFYGPFTEDQRTQWIKRSAPIRLVIDECNRRYPGDAALLVQDSFHAGLQSEVYENHWHQANVRDAIRRAPDAAAIGRLLDGWGVKTAIGHLPSRGTRVFPSVLESYLNNCALPEVILDDFVLSRLEPHCVGPAIRADIPRPRLTARAGTYDDVSPYILFRGGWRHDDIFPEAFNATSSYSDEAGSVAILAMQGPEVIWVYTAAPNRGIATVTIDGVDRGTLDQYSPSIQWQRRYSLQMSDNGPHLLVIRATGTSRPEASGHYIDVDSFEVKP